MTIVIRLVQQVLLLLAAGAAVTAFLVGTGVVGDVDTCVLTPEDGSGRESCSQYEAEASAAFAIGSSGVAAALVAVALNGMVRPKTQVQAPQYPQQTSG